MQRYFQCDLDIGKMFLNFVLHEDLKRLAGGGCEPCLIHESKGRGLGEQLSILIGTLVQKLDGSHKLTLPIHLVDDLAQ